jgi:hypothetical protein
VDSTSLEVETTGFSGVGAGECEAEGEQGYGGED